MSRPRSFNPRTQMASRRVEIRQTLRTAEVVDRGGRGWAAEQVARFLRGWPQGSTVVHGDVQLGLDEPEKPESFRVVRGPSPNRRNVTSQRRGEFGPFASPPIVPACRTLR